MRPKPDLRLLMPILFALTFLLPCSLARADGGAYPIVGKADLPPQSFIVRYGDFTTTKDRGMVGGGGSYEAELTEAPHYEIPGNGTLQLNLNITKRVILENDPGGLAVITWSMTLMDMDNPSGLITQVRVKFDTGEVSSDEPGQSMTQFIIPKGARHILGIESDFAWQGNAHTCRWDAQVAQSGPNGLLIGAGAAAVYYFASRKRHYLAVRLIDSESNPVPDEDYEMNLANGDVRNGKTDKSGNAMETFELGDADIPSPCSVSFPKMDGSEWNAVDQPST